ncbi:2Fe-2S iron-sulfur cluster binding domain-containing protein [Pseudomaricurvus alkylphenolicus]|jgi:2Fe-2S ferredoxin|uniref:2Fe-2S iron-sulfur cluster-binding protein n=1 Tax=Pseudomaricurvus alkylphenolicus TaxID=1306991 RepID=UPI001422E9E4|nr:2Fe-2S iron-sulfur cluster-binding protein [Pseudomaricurvus alkylphenolicus]NIB43951.1 2Fe-2S iron-sulfur cluster binding domain-containing protein [Pseudomaricurvus alkylphenolicus]
MPKIIVLPHRDICPKGEVVQARQGASVTESLVAAGVDIEHSCGMNCACTTCHIILREGADSVAPADDLERTITRGVMGFGPDSRLGCQVRLGRDDLVVEIP